MKRMSVFVLLANLLLSACAPAQTPQPASQPQSPTAAGTAGASLVAAAAKVTDVCSLMPADLAAKLVPGASPPQSQKFAPFKCTITNGTSVLEVTLGAYDTGGPVNGAELIPGLAAGGYFERLGGPDDAYLTVLLSQDQGELYVEVAGHDGKDHKDDAIAVAQYILARLR
jgi:hypothetical protein